MTVGMSTACVFPADTVSAIELLAENGVREIEIFFNSMSEMTVAGAQDIMAAVKYNQLKVLAVHPCMCRFENFMFFTDYQQRFLDGAKIYCEFADVAAMLGAPLMVLHGAHTDRPSNREVCYERFGRLSELIGRSGVSLAQENVYLYRSQSTDYILGMKQALGERAAFVLDIKQCIRSGIEPYEMADAMGDGLRHIHISDNGPQGDCLLPTEGQFDFAVFLSHCDYTKIASKVIEVYESAYQNVDQLFESCRMLNCQISTI